jgi:hypothetical protein
MRSKSRPVKHRSGSGTTVMLVIRWSGDLEDDVLGLLDMEEDLQGAVNEGRDDTEDVDADGRKEDENCCDRCRAPDKTEVFNVEEESKSMKLKHIIPSIRRSKRHVVMTRR